MEDYFTFVDVFSPLVFFNLPWAAADTDVRRMFELQWSSLRQAVMIGLKPDKSKPLASQVTSYFVNIEVYATAVMQVCPCTLSSGVSCSLCPCEYSFMQAYQGTACSTIKLHYARYHVGHNMASHGFLDKFQEYWIERMVGDVGATIHHNARLKVECTFARVHLCRRAASRSRYAYPTVPPAV